jgi:cell division protein FtsN
MTRNISRALWVLAVIIIIAAGAYFVLHPSGTVEAPAPAATVTTQSAAAPAPSDTVQKAPADTGASGVYDSNTPAGSAAECAACGQYTGSQKAQCLAALNC